jgi:hypothetical protein
MFITGIPYAFKQSGFILGTLLLVIVGAITGLCLYTENTNLKDNRSKENTVSIQNQKKTERRIFELTGNTNLKVKQSKEKTFANSN